MKKILPFILVGLSFCSCKTELVYLSVKEPAPISIPMHSKKAGIINRSNVSDENKKLDEIDQIFSAEGKNIDKDGSLECIRGLNDELQSIKRFDYVKVLDKVDLKTSGAGFFPTELSWDEIRKICFENEVDILFVVEMFDTDSKIAYSLIPTTIRTPLGDIPATEHQASLATVVKSGFRIYEPKNKYVIDENTLTDQITISKRGISPLAAARALVGRKEAVKASAYHIGKDYAKSIEPYWIRVSRDYYVKGNDNFRTATRMARTGNWDKAAELWKKETMNVDGKLAGRGCYNMAIISEINGELDIAIEWAQKSYENYNNKLALQYLRILKNRKAQNNKLKKQQQE